MADAIDAAIQSAESLFVNLLDRSLSSSLTAGPLETTDMGGGGGIDPEASLLPQVLPSNHSLTTIGAASLDPTLLTAQAHAATPLELDSIDPRQSLTALVGRSSSTSLVSESPPSYDIVCKMLRERERDVELAARVGQALLRRNELLEADLTSLLEQRQQLEQQVAQLSHTIGQKEELLKLYARDAHEAEVTSDPTCVPEESPSWVHALTEECRELRESNLELRAETVQLRKETADIEQKEKELVQNCLEQFTEAKQRLNELREEIEAKQLESQQLQHALKDLSIRHEEQLARNQQVGDESEALRDQLSDAQSAQTQLTNEVTELQERYQETSVLLKEAREELTALKSINSSPGDNGEHAITDQESIVREIEEVLRKELIAASTLPERPRSPNNYAHQRTMVVMETVRAATLATARRLERLTAEADKVKGQEKVKGDERGLLPTQTKQGFSPLAASSPGDLRIAHRTKGTSVSMATESPRGVCPPSPIFSEAGSTVSLPEEHIRYRNQPYVAPEKLQIVKPMEGSVTLLKWKLLATPQLGGAKSFFSDASRPGVHLKKWRAGGVRDSLSEESRMKSLSTTDLSRLNATFPQASGSSRVSRKESIRKHRQQPPPPSSGVEQSEGMNDISDLLTSSQRREERAPVATSGERETSNSLLGTVGSLLGTGWSRLTNLSSRKTSTSTADTQSLQDQTSTSTDGLGGLL